MPEENVTPSSSKRPSGRRFGKTARRLVIGFILLIVLLIGLILLAPTLLSTGPGRSFVLGIVNKKLDGKVEVTDWSLGWFSGVKISGVKVSDATNRQLVSVETVSIPMPLWHAVTGKYPIGDAKIDGVDFDAAVGSDGILNFSKLVKPAEVAPASSAPGSPTPATAPAGTSANPVASSGFSIPDVFGQMTIDHVHGTYSRPGKPALTLDSLKIVAGFPEKDGPITAKVDGSIKTGAQPATVLALDLNQAIKRGTAVQLSAGKLTATARSAGDSADSVAVALSVTAGSGSAVGFHFDKCSFDLPRLNKQFALTPADLNLTTGTFVIAADGTFDPATSAISLPLFDANLADLTATRTDKDGKLSPVFDHYAVKTHLEASASFGTIVAATIKNLSIVDSQNIFSVTKAGTTELAFSRSEAGVISGTGGAIALAVDLPRLKALLERFKAPAAADAKPAAALDSGNLTLNLSMTPEPTRLHIVLDGKIAQLVVSAVSGKTAAEDVPLAMDISVAPDFNTVDVSKASVTSRAASLSVDNATIELNAKTTLEKLVKATIRLDVPDLKTAMTELELFSKPAVAAASAKPGQPVAEPVVYDGGVFAASAVISGAGTNVDVTTSVDGKNISYHRGKATATLEPLVVSSHLILTSLADDDFNVVVKLMTAGVTSAKVSITDGSINHVMTSRDLKLTANLSYDLDKLLTEFKPMLSTSMQTMKVAGVSTKAIVLGGSYPAGKPFNEAVKPLTVDGAVGADSLDYNGVKTDKPFELWFNLRNGILTTDKVDKTAADPIFANGGQIHPDHLLIDLTGEVMRLTTPANDVLIEHFTINPLFADTFLADYLNNPLFVESKDATGLLSVMLKSCDRMAVSSTPDDVGSVSAVIDIAGLHIGVANDEIKKAFKGNSIEGTVKGATVVVAKGMMTEHFSISSSVYAINLDGVIRMSDQALMPMAISIPLKFVAKTHMTQDPTILAAIPDAIVLPMKGTVHKYTIDGGAAEKALADAVKKGGAKAIGDKLLNGKKPEDALGDLLNKQLGGKKK